MIHAQSHTSRWSHEHGRVHTVAFKLLLCLRGHTLIFSIPPLLLLFSFSLSLSRSQSVSATSHFLPPLNALHVPRGGAISNSLWSLHLLPSPSFSLLYLFLSSFVLFLNPLRIFKVMVTLAFSWEACHYRQDAVEEVWPAFSIQRTLFISQGSPLLGWFNLAVTHPS